mmetsp:Transcript_21105/g.61043  ORF Transcript_21105/g.61043 Transcript_21105/m.61043 type:complete len:299 (+) Transcript_21105:70-966(+)
MPSTRNVSSRYSITAVFVVFLAQFTTGLNTVLYGPAARELLLLTAKLAAREGMEASLVCSPGSEDGCRRLMYGDDYGSEDKPGCARPVSSGEDMQTALEGAESIIFVAHDEPIDEKSYNTLISAAGDNLSKVVLMSKTGVTKAKGGFFGGKEVELQKSEACLKDICRSKNLDLSITRAGNLKGGGPGEDGNEFGLDKCYYNTLIDAAEASVTMAHDKFTLGLDCRKGDPIEMPNMFSQMGSKSSFEACDYETNRILAAAGTVAATLYEKPVELTICAAKAREPPTMEMWETALDSISQ